MPDVDPDLAALQAKLDQELNKPVRRNELGAAVVSTAARTVITAVVALLLAGWVMSSCFSSLKL